MYHAYKVLGLTPAATEAEIRAKYLELIREFTPEQHPERFAEIRAAYDQITPLTRRAEYHLFNYLKQVTVDDLIKELQCRTAPARITLDQLTKLVTE